MEFEKVIGVIMDPEESVANTGATYSEAAGLIVRHLMKSRSAATPVWRPYIKQDGVFYSGTCRDICLDAKRFYPHAKPGDVVYAACVIRPEKDYEVWINLIGVAEVFLNGKCLFSSWKEAKKSEKDDSYISMPVQLKSDVRQELVIKAVCTETSFGFRLNISPPRCVSLWASFYLVNVRVLLPNAGLEKEEGIAVSPLYTGAKTAEEAYGARYDFERNPCYAFPKPQKESDCFDFEMIYGKGNAAFAYTAAIAEGFVTLVAQSPARLFVNGEMAASLEAGEQTEISLSKGDVLLVKSIRNEEAWGFNVSDCDGVGLPFLDTNRAGDFKFAFCGPFYQRGVELKLPPEYAGCPLKPFPDGNGGRVFWRFQHAYLRAYHDSSFFGQWYYATMLSLLGIKCCGETLGLQEAVDTFINAVSFLADWYEYAVYDSEVFGSAPFMRLVASHNHLDNIGTIGVNFIEAYQRTGDKRYLPLIHTLRRQICHTVPRFSDGTFCRRMDGTMWADDFFMSNPFLSRLYSRMHDDGCLEDILCQLKGFCKRLYMPEEKIFSHIYFLKQGEKNNIPWGRGNGWIAFAMSEILMHVEKDNPAFEAVLKVFREFCEGLAALQSESGLWHQVLNRPDSYLETSCTAMFSLAFFRGVRYGWLPERFLEYAERGLQGILRQCVDKEGIVYGVCMGSSCSMDVQYYLDLTTVKDDNHGTGIVLMLLCERIAMENQKNAAALPVFRGKRV